MIQQVQRLGQQRIVSGEVRVTLAISFLDIRSAREFAMCCETSYMIFHECDAGVNIFHHLSKGFVIDQAAGTWRIKSSRRIVKI